MANPSRWIMPSISLCLLPYTVSGQPQPKQSYSGGSEKQAAVVIAAAMLVFVTFYCITCWFRRFRDRRFVRPTRADADVGDHGVPRQREDHQVHGLDQETVMSFPSFRYVEVKEHKLENAELICAVCLGEFKDEEMLRLMLPCNHVFHVFCIDSWLSSRSTCPVCRARVAPSSREMVPPEAEGPGTGLGDEEMRDLESSDRYLIGQDEAKRSGSDELPDWLESRIEFSRSRSSGHLTVPSDENLERFTLRLPEEARRQLTKTYTVKWTRNHTTQSDHVGSETNSFVHGRRHNH